MISHPALFTAEGLTYVQEWLVCTKKNQKLENTLTWTVVPICGSNTSGNIKVNNTEALIS